MIASVVTVSVIGTAAADEESFFDRLSDIAAVSDDGGSSDAGSSSTGGTVGQYNLDQLATDLLVSHISSANELEGGEMLEYVQEAQQADYDGNFITFSCDQDLYSSFGFNVDKMKGDAKNYATSPQYQDPMSGYSFIYPNELVVASVNRYNECEAIVETINDMDLDNASKIDGYDDLATNTSQLKWGQNSDEWDFQTTNTIGVDVDGDGLDELVYFGLAYKRKDPNMGSGIYLKLFDRLPDADDSTKYNWETVDEFSIIMESSKYVLDICAQESKGYVPLAAGDYDGDSKEEVAFYMPDKGTDSDAADARVLVYNFDQKDDGSYSHSELAHFYLKDFTSDYGQMGSGWYLPTVALSTTSIRPGDRKNGSEGAAIYDAHDDLIVTVSVPNHYRDKNLDLNYITKIFSMDSGDGDVTIINASLIQRKLAGIIKVFPAEEKDD